MKCSDQVKEVSKSWGGILALTILLILIVVAIFNSSDTGRALTGKKANKVEWEDLQEQNNPEDRRFVIKDGQKLVVF